MANNVTKVNTIAIADIGKVNTQNDSDLEKLNVEEFTAAPPDWRGDRAILGGVYAYTTGGSALYLNEIHYKAINSDTDSADFGDLQETRSIQRGSGSTGTRTVMGGGYTGAASSANIDYTTVASVGTVGDAGDLDTAAYYGAGDGASNGVTCLFLGGLSASGAIANIEEMTMASTGASDNGGEIRSAAFYGAASNGDSKSIILDDTPSTGKTELSAHNFVSGADATDSGNVLTDGVGVTPGCCANATIVVFAGGQLSGGTATDTIQWVPVDSSADSENVGDLVQIVYALSGTSNNDGTKGEFYGALGQGGGEYIQDDIQKITFASLTDSVDEGDLTFTVPGGTYTDAGGASYLSSQSGG